LITFYHDLFFVFKMLYICGIYKGKIMGKEMREQINKVKNFGQFINENKSYISKRQTPFLFAPRDKIIQLCQEKQM